MDTIYNVGEEIYIKGIIKSIVIDEDGITYDIEYSNARGTIMSSFTKDQIATAHKLAKMYIHAP